MIGRKAIWCILSRCSLTKSRVAFTLIVVFHKPSTGSFVRTYLQEFEHRSVNFICKCYRKITSKKHWNCYRNKRSDNIITITKQTISKQNNKTVSFSL